MCAHVESNGSIRQKELRTMRNARRRTLPVSKALVDTNEIPEISGATLIFLQVSRNIPDEFLLVSLFVIYFPLNGTIIQKINIVLYRRRLETSNWNHKHEEAAY